MSDLKEKWEKQTFDTDIGQKVKVERQELLPGQLTEVADETMAKLGVLFGQSDPSIKHLTYLGSAAVHVFGSYSLLDKDGKPQLAFFSHTSPLGRVNELVAGAAGQDLLKSIARRYGRKAPKKRSGF